MLGGAVCIVGAAVFALRLPRLREEGRRIIITLQATAASPSEELSDAGVLTRDGRFLLMELEINEPFLYLGSSSTAAERFADAIGRRTAENERTQR